MKIYLHVGGCVAAGFDATGEYLMAISHNGRGVFSTKSWKRVARDYDLGYPKNGVGIGIGPIDGQCIPVTEIDYSTGVLLLTSPDGKIHLRYEEGVIDVSGEQA
jgi:hypothetical protein